MGQPDKAQETCREGLKLLPKQASLWYELGMCQARRKQWDPAALSLKKACEFDPENLTYVNALGFTLGCAGRFDESYACFAKPLGEAKAHYNVARMLHHVKRDDECMEHLRQALMAKPDMQPAQQLWASCRIQQGCQSHPANRYAVVEWDRSNEVISSRSISFGYKRNGQAPTNLVGGTALHNVRSCDTSLRTETDPLPCLKHATRQALLQRDAGGHSGSAFLPTQPKTRLMRQCFLHGVTDSRRSRVLQPLNASLAVSSGKANRASPIERENAAAPFRAADDCIRNYHGPPMP